MDIDMGALFENLKEAEKRQGISLDDESREKLIAHLLMVLDKNKVVNLTRIDSLESGIELHIEDSLICLPEISNAPEGKFCDIGTGAGFPGIPLGIVTGREGTLIDSVKKKALAVHEFIEGLGLTMQLEAKGVRAEELALDYPLAYSVVIARALTSLPSLLELASPLLRPGGQLIAMKGRPTPEEVLEGLKVANKVGFDLVTTREAVVGAELAKRTIFVFEKTHKPSLTLPRRTGLAQNSPLA